MKDRSGYLEIYDEASWELSTAPTVILPENPDSDNQKRSLFYSAAGEAVETSSDSGVDRWDI